MIEKQEVNSDKYGSSVNRPGLFSAVLHAVLGIVRRLIEFFTLTEDDRLAAGIYLGDEHSSKKGFLQ